MQRLHGFAMQRLHGFAGEEFSTSSLVHRGELLHSGVRLDHVHVHRGLRQILGFLWIHLDHLVRLVRVPYASGVRRQSAGFPGAGCQAG